MTRGGAGESGMADHDKGPQQEAQAANSKSSFDRTEVSATLINQLAPFFCAHRALDSSLEMLYM